MVSYEILKTLKYMFDSKYEDTLFLFNEINWWKKAKDPTIIRDLYSLLQECDLLAKDIINDKFLIKTLLKYSNEDNEKLDYIIRVLKKYSYLVTDNQCLSELFKKNESSENSKRYMVFEKIDDLPDDKDKNGFFKHLSRCKPIRDDNIQNDYRSVVKELVFRFFQCMSHIDPLYNEDIDFKNINLNDSFEFVRSVLQHVPETLDSFLDGDVPVIIENLIFISILHYPEALYLLFDLMNVKEMKEIFISKIKFFIITINSLRTKNIIDTNQKKKELDLIVLTLIRKIYIGLNERMLDKETYSSILKYIYAVLDESVIQRDILYHIFTVLGEISVDLTDLETLYKCYMTKIYKLVEKSELEDYYINFLMKNKVPLTNDLRSFLPEKLQRKAEKSTITRITTTTRNLFPTANKTGNQNTSSSDIYCEPLIDLLLNNEN